MASHDATRREIQGPVISQRALFFDWGVSTMFGWGVYGLNLLRHWRSVAGTPAYALGPLHLESLGGMDVLRLRAMAPHLIESDQMRLRLEDQGRDAVADGVMLHCLGNRFGGSPWPSAGGRTGHITCAAIFFEATDLAETAHASHEYDMIIAGSSWGELVLRAHGVTNVATVIQGIDSSLFHPAPGSGALEGRFAVFSGGKLEHRKAQDLALLGFRIFAARHPEAMLVTSWHSPWPASVLTVNANPAIAPVALGADGAVDMAGWAAANGLDTAQFVDLGRIPNHLMGAILREMDAAIFPNRCEGGTNLVAMEAVACGVPSIVSDNTGHADLTATGGVFPLVRQSRVADHSGGTEGWGESDPEEIAAALEHIWADRESARRRAAAGAAAMAAWNWRNQVERLHAVLKDF